MCVYSSVQDSIHVFPTTTGSTLGISVIARLPKDVFTDTRLCNFPLISGMCTTITNHLCRIMSTNALTVLV